MYELLLKQIKAVIDKDIPLVSNLANISALLYTMEAINWAGFYLVDKNRLVLGPFQGEVACTIIPLGNGVCGTAAERKETIIVDNVHEFKGHIACSSKSKSEIVVPIIKNNELIGVIDIDSPIYSRFSNSEKEFLEKVVTLIASL
ncbi:MAG: GAF domain-containing protein [Bacilli bacterium]|nr:GAF domain-containing protein [Bacilli bacterium]